MSLGIVEVDGGGGVVSAGGAVLVGLGFLEGMGREGGEH